MSAREKICDFLTGLKEVIIIACAVLAVIIAFAITNASFIKAQPPQPEMLREIAFNRACEFWNTTFGCSRDNYTQPFLYYQDIADEGQRPYSVQELCFLLKLNEETCYQRCGCSLEA